MRVIIGALDVNDFLPKGERRALAASLNTLRASPTFANWREGATRNVDEWLTPKTVRDAHSGRRRRARATTLAMSFLRGPMTRTEIQLPRELAAAGTVAARERAVAYERVEVGA